jgi:diadenosine tetraphosphate (Ap4A) HIT family hydrolase
MPRERWDALVRGEGCPLCAEIASGVESNAYFHKIADLRISELRLAANQNVPGYCVLVCKQHVREPYELESDERALFFEDMMSAAQALEWVFAPTKMNFELLGNIVPHLHCHINPRQYGDPWPGSPVRPGEELVLLTPQEYRDRVERIRAALR